MCVCVCVCVYARARTLLRVLGYIYVVVLAQNIITYTSFKTYTSINLHKIKYIIGFKHTKVPIYTYIYISGLLISLWGTDNPAHGEAVDVGYAQKRKHMKHLTPQLAVNNTCMCFSSGQQ